MPACLPLLPPPGQRHAFHCVYKAGSTKAGKLVALDLQFYSNGGHSHDLSYSVMDRCLLHSDGCYSCPNFRARGTVCKTNQSSHTAFRGFGGPQVRALAGCTVPALHCSVVQPACKWCS